MPRACSIIPNPRSDPSAHPEQYLRPADLQSHRDILVPMQQLKSKHPNKKEKLETTGVSKSIRIQTTKAQLKQHVNIAPFLSLYTKD